MGILFFDTETTGKIINYLPPDHPRQPRIVQLAAILCDDDATPRSKISVMIKPDGWTIPEEASRIHGHTTETCQRCGIPLPVALNLFSEMCERAHTLVAHNLDYDATVIDGEYHRIATAGRYVALKSYCTMKAATPVLNMPGRYGPKWPSLRETYRHFFNADFDGAHDALADVVACVQCYFKLVSPAQIAPVAEMACADDGGK